MKQKHKGEFHKKEVDLKVHKIYFENHPILDEDSQIEPKLYPDWLVYQHMKISKCNLEIIREFMNGKLKMQQPGQWQTFLYSIIPKDG